MIFIGVVQEDCYDLARVATICNKKINLKIKI